MLTVILLCVCLCVCVCVLDGEGNSVFASRALIIIIMEICKAPTLQLKALNKHTHIMYIEMENVIKKKKKCIYWQVFKHNYAKDAHAHAHTHARTHTHTHCTYTSSSMIYAWQFIWPATVIAWPVSVNHFRYLLDDTPVSEMSSMITDND